MPEGGVEWKAREDILSYEEIERLVRLFVGWGVTKVRLTGGEPSVRKGYVGLVGRLASIPGLEKVLLTTNGGRLVKDAEALAQAGLGGVNVSLDTLQRDRFEHVTRRDSRDQVLAGIDAALAAGLATKVNVVSMAGINQDEAADFAKFAKEKGVSVRFIEFMPFLGNQWQPDSVVSARETRARIEEAHSLTPVPGAQSDVAKEYLVDGGPGKVGFVTSVTESFCGGCNRVRLTAEGGFKTCLFLPPALSLRDMLRDCATDEAVKDAVSEAMKTKWAAHPPMNSWRQRDHLTMVQIGG